MMKKTLLASGVAALPLTAAAPASAQGYTFSWGGTVTSNYISRGVTQTQNRPAFQPWVEVESNGFYGGLWASNVRFGGGDSDRVEVDIYGGYRWSIENTSLMSAMRATSITAAAIAVASSTRWSSMRPER